MNKKCPKCKLNNFADANECLRCKGDLRQVASKKSRNGFAPTLLMRVGVVFVLLVLGLAGFYLSLIWSSEPLTAKEREKVTRAIAVLKEKGFTDEVFYLENLAVFRGSDNWLNGSVPKENAYAATNYPFEIMTLYPDFFTYPQDDLERASILLHEAKHLQGYDEKLAYSYVWANRSKLGWTEANYKHSVVWKNVKLQTKEFAPHLFE